MTTPSANRGPLEPETPDSTPRPHLFRDLMTAGAVAVAYYVAGKIGLSLASVNASATAVWPPTGIAIAALLVLGYRVWPGVLVGAFLTNLTTAGTVATSIGIATGNTLEGLLATYLVRRFAGGSRAFENPESIFKYALLGGVISTTVSATVGVTSLALGRFASWDQYGAVWWTWWLGDAAGALVLAPFLVLLVTEPRTRWSGRQVAEAILLLSIVIMVGLFVFAGLSPAPNKNYPLEFLCIPPLVWTAFRFTRREAAAGIVLLSAIAIAGTVRGLGPFARDSQNEALLLLQAFTAVTSVMILAVTAIVVENKRIAARIRQLNDELEQRVAERTDQLRVAYLELQNHVRELAASQEKLQWSEARLRDAQQVAHVGSWEWDIERNVVWWSDELYALYGLDPKTFGASYEAVLEHVHPEDRRTFRRVVETALEDGRPFGFDHRIIRPNGEVRTIFGQGRLFTRDDGTPIRMTGTAQDVTDRKGAEEERAHLLREQIARREAEEANRLKDEFLAILSHELRTPLHAIVGWAQLLQEGRLDAAATARAIETINRNAHIQSQLVSDLLDISRMASGQLALRKQPVDLAAVIEGVRDSMSPAAQGRGIVIRSELEPVGVVLGDPDRLQQVVSNLTSNAIKFATDGGKVTISLTTDDSMARIRVEDDGFGIDPEFLPYVFERFRQRDSSSTRRQGGLGLGLAIVKHLVELHGGSVSAANCERGTGAVLTVSLPLADAVTTASGAYEPSFPLTPREPIDLETGDAGEVLQGRRVLLVEDEHDSRELITMLMSRSGAEVLAVGSSAEALAVLGMWRPDLLISDIEMPGESGYDLIEQVRALPSESGGAIPAIALTAHAGAENARKAIRAGYHAHVSKPVQWDGLIRILSGLIRTVPSRE